MLNIFLSVSFPKEMIPIINLISAIRSSKSDLCMCLFWVLNVDSAASRQQCFWCLQNCSCHPNDQIMSASESVISPGVSWRHYLSPTNKSAAGTCRLKEHAVDSLSDNVYPLFVFLQKLFVIITFSKHIVEQMVSLIGWVMTPPWGQYRHPV